MPRLMRITGQRWCGWWAGCYGPSPTSGAKETGPLGGREGEVSGVGMLGVTYGGPTGQISNLQTILASTAVAALTEAIGDVGNFHTVNILAAVSALPEAHGDVGDFHTINPLAAVAALVEIQVQSSQDVPSRALM